ncbi:hypothetical protein O181_034783 [Austropuccinia psidii MF-1]|uniref:Glutamine amidotransferase domain-containing protein n=1 Tax=Austropuccinia psidii MF-1 TaxID=1389203 RepID=A0A9Q3H7N9_9BASI|nr:hypothetical protein [Austropuccinia psidii MF-1]
MKTSIVTANQIVDKAHDDDDDDDEGIPTILILKTGVLVPPLRPKLGTYHQVFCQFFQNGLKFDQEHQDHQRHGSSSPERQLRIISFNVMESECESIEYPSCNLLDRSQGLVITGSACNAFDDEPWINDLIKFCQTNLLTRVGNQEDFKPDDLDASKQNNLKIFGICFGHQILARSLGSVVDRNPNDWELGLTGIKLSSTIGLKIFPNSPSTLTEKREKDTHPNYQEGHINLIECHRDIVFDLPHQCYPIGSTSNSAIQGFIKFNNRSDPPISHQDELFLRQISIICLQAHPEYTLEILSGIVEFKFKDHPKFNASILLKDKDDIENHDGIYVASRFMKIMGI